MQEKPECIGIILDGNRRWAEKMGLPKLEGHRAGLERIRDVVRWVRDRGIPHIAMYMFSTENWSREEAEVAYLMDLFRTLVEKEMGRLGEESVRIRFVGERERFAPDLQSLMAQVEERTRSNTAITLWACLSYGGRAEIVKAANRLKNEGGDITEATFNDALWSGEMPDADIIIRTSGERRLSGFLTWKSVYSELFFLDTYWPDFSEEALDGVLEEYGTRDRRMGR